MLRQLVKPLITVLAILLIIASPSSAKAASIYEYLNTGGDGDSNWTYSNNWTAQSFTVGTLAHSITAVRVNIKRVGSPGTLTLSIRATSSELPTGTDLCSGTLNGSAISTAYSWYEFDVDDISISSGTEYSIVLRAVAGDSSNYVLWQKDSGGGLASAIASTSDNGGVTWTSNAPSDRLFEIYGSASIEILGASVFQNYVATGDWLIVARVQNTYKPYYPNDEPSKYFKLQLVDNVTVKASVPFVEWERQPLAIYISPALAATMSWSSNTTALRIQSNVDSSVSTDRLMQSTEWISGSLTNLDSWVRTNAKDIETYSGVTLLEKTEKGYVLNSAGAVLFIAGVPLLNQVRPNLFSTSYVNINPASPTYTSAGESNFDFTTMVGPYIAGEANTMGADFGVTGKEFASWALFLFYIVVSIFFAAKGSGIVGIALGAIFIIAGAVFGIIGLNIILGIALLCAILLVRQIFFNGG